MKMLYLLIILTQNAAGNINAAFVNTETLDQCQQKIMMVEGLFRAWDIPVIESSCIRSDMHFSEFGHISDSNSIRHFYMAYFNDEDTRVVSMPDWRTCMLKKKNIPDKNVYCSSSVQSVL